MEYKWAKRKMKKIFGIVALCAMLIGGAVTAYVYAGNTACSVNSGTITVSQHAQSNDSGCVKAKLAHPGGTYSVIVNCYDYPSGNFMDSKSLTVSNPYGGSVNTDVIFCNLEPNHTYTFTVSLCN